MSSFAMPVRNANVVLSIRDAWILSSAMILTSAWSWCSNMLVACQAVPKVHRLFKMNSPRQEKTQLVTFGHPVL